ncbi:MAG: DUF1572 family protein [Terrimonas ferruginea]|uniref:DUF1572 family protein n=1 Tax=Terrimonas ferruginea TaxID=249 RepID=UPI00092A05B7|nr:DUF1572 family protein [Terrimonas ferruginea]MBN8784096.1 DUF1572 family protein [Terrimonas ferruginea]OJW39296.1 MAG: hypothetical protein BGO56_06580 [Sphingobacteriales bacterium 48-107]
MSYLKSVTAQLNYYKTLAEKAMAQLPDEKLYWQFNEESNSIATIVRHMSGNMISRFTDFLVSDGEKSWRKRDEEFENPVFTREELMTIWEKGWQCVLDTLATLDESHLEDIVYIRNEAHTVTEALNRQLAHYPYHVGQIVYIARMGANERWNSLTIPRKR